jgi:acetyl-CoA carboxylase carboxyl transferase subunit alpha
MKTTFLDFEQPIAELEAKIEELRFVQDDSALDISEEIRRLQTKSQTLTRDIYAKLNAWQVSQVARHPQRPYTLDYVQGLFTDFRTARRSCYAAAPRLSAAWRAPTATVMVIGHQKGRDTKEKIYRNFGMPRPEGYRKALRLMRLAEKFRLPIFTFIDTPGAYPGIDAEERGQSEAIARNLYVMAELQTPIICSIVGARAVRWPSWGDRTMTQYSTYSVISPEGCASILWKSADKASVAAETLGITADRLKANGLVDRIIEEPLGGAQRDWDTMFQSMRRALTDTLAELRKPSLDALLAARYQRLRAYGSFKETPAK